MNIYFTPYFPSDPKIVFERQKTKQKKWPSAAPVQSCLGQGILSVTLHEVMTDNPHKVGNLWKQSILVLPVQTEWLTHRLYVKIDRTSPLTPTAQI